MSSIYQAVNLKPAAFWPLGQTGTFNDVSGYANNVSASGSLGLSLSYGNLNSTIFPYGVYPEFPSDIAIAGSERQSFTITATFRPITTNENIVESNSIWSHVDDHTGLWHMGTEYFFYVDFQDGGYDSVSFDIQTNRRVDLAGVYTGDSMLLYIDGELVAEKTLTIAQKADTFSPSNGNMTIYSGASHQSLSINNVGIYNRALSGTEIKKLYSAGYQPDRTNNAYLQFDGKAYSTSQSSLSIDSKQVISTALDWNFGLKEDVVVTKETLVPTFVSDYSVPGYWMGTYSLDAGPATYLYGANIDWDGMGAKVEVSTDASTWEEAYRGKNVFCINPGFNPVDQVLYVKVSFEGGVMEDSSYVDSVTITVFAQTATDSTSYQNLNDREVRWTGNGIDIRQEQNVNILSNDWGTNTVSGRNLYVMDNAIAPEFTPKTIEAWIKIKDAGWDWAATLNTSDALYKNGIVYSTPAYGEWVVVHYVKAAGFTGDIHWGGPMQIGRVVYYEDALTATDISNVYKAYVGKNQLVAGDNSVVAITEPGTAATIYAHDWSILSSG